jgi:hypothetical protein
VKLARARPPARTHAHARTHTHTKKGGNQKGRIDVLETNSKNKNITDLHSGINKFMGSYQPRTNTVKDEKGDQLQTPILFCLGGGIIFLSY